MKINCAHLSLATPQHYSISLGCLCPNHVLGLGTSFQVSNHLSSLHGHHRHRLEITLSRILLFRLMYCTLFSAFIALELDICHHFDFPQSANGISFTLSTNRTIDR